MEPDYGIYSYKHSGKLLNMLAVHLYIACGILGMMLFHMIFFSKLKTTGPLMRFIGVRC